MAKEKLERIKPHTNADTISYVDHGRTTLTTAIVTAPPSKFGGTAKRYNEIDAALEEKVRDVTINIAYIKHEATSRHYVRVDCPGHADYVKNMITGAAQMDGAISVRSVVDGPMPQTREHILLTRQVGVPYTIVFLNRRGMVGNAELLKLVEMGACELLSKYDFPDDDTPIIKGSAKLVLEGNKGELGEVVTVNLADVLDTCIPTSECAVDGTFLAPVGDVSSIPGRGTVATGRIGRGVVKVDEEIEIVGIAMDSDKPKIDKTTCMGMEMFCKLLDQDQAGDSVGILLRGMKHEDVQRGQVLAKPGSIKPHTEFTGEVYTLSGDEGGRHTPFLNNYRLQFCFRMTDVTGSTTLPEGKEMVIPGNSVSITVKLIASIVMEEGLRFTIREDGHIVDAGVVAKTLR